MSKVVVVGGGVVGLCSAYELAKSGAEVTILESGSESDRGCSWGNAGYLVPSHVVPLPAPGMIQLGTRLMMQPGGPFSISKMLGNPGWLMSFAKNCSKSHVDRVSPLIRDLNLLSRDIYEAYELTWGESFGYRKSGLLMVCQSEKALEHERSGAKFAGDLGLEYEECDRDRVEALQGGLTVNTVGGIHYLCDGMIDPRQFLEVLRSKLREFGVTILYDTKVTGWSRSGHEIRAAISESEEFLADEFVLAAGSWSGKVAAQLRLDIPLVPGKGMSFRIETEKSKLKVPMLLVEARVAATPLDDGVRFGGTMSLGEWSLQPNDLRLQTMKKSISKVLPELRGEFSDSHDVWSGLRPCLPDGLPIIGRAQGWDNLVLATGHAMMGMSLGPVTGRLVSEIVNGEKTSLPTNSLKVERF